MRFRSKSLVAAILLTVVGLAPIGTSALASYAGIMKAPPVDPTTTQITIVPGAGINTSSAGFSPANVVVVIGVNNTIIWTNMDTALHTATSTTGTISSGDLMSGHSYTVTLTTPGTYSYSCAYHSWMHGTVVVKGNAVPEFPFPVLVLLAAVILAALGFRLVGNRKATKPGSPLGVGKALHKSLRLSDQLLLGNEILSPNLS